MIRNISEILDSLSKEYKQPQMKLQQMVRKGELFKVVRGLYETDRNTPGEVLAAAIYGPSYLSFENALSHHGLIPEKVPVFTSATFGKNKTKKYETNFGTYIFQDIPSSVFAYGVYLENLNAPEARPFAIATPEKALCDKLYKLPPFLSIKKMQQFLFESMRIDVEDIRNLDKALIKQISPLYGKRNLQILEKTVTK